MCASNNSPLLGEFGRRVGLAVHGLLVDRDRPCLRHPLEVAGEGPLRQVELLSRVGNPVSPWQ